MSGCMGHKLYLYDVIDVCTGGVSGSERHVITARRRTLLPTVPYIRIDADNSRADNLNFKYCDPGLPYNMTSQTHGTPTRQYAKCMCTWRIDIILSFSLNWRLTILVLHSESCSLSLSLSLYIYIYIYIYGLPWSCQLCNCKPTLNTVKSTYIVLYAFLLVNFMFFLQ